MNLLNEGVTADFRTLAETHYQLGVAHAWAGECMINSLLHESEICSPGNWPLAEKSLTDAVSVLSTRMASHPTEKEELVSIVNDIKGRIAEHKEMEKGVFNDSYVKAPGGTKIV